MMRCPKIKPPRWRRWNGWKNTVGLMNPQRQPRGHVLQVVHCHRLETRYTDTIVWPLSDLQGHSVRLPSSQIGSIQQIVNLVMQVQKFIIRTQHRNAQKSACVCISIKIKFASHLPTYLLVVYLHHGDSYWEREGTGVLVRIHRVIIFVPVIPILPLTCTCGSDPVEWQHVAIVITTTAAIRHIAVGISVRSYSIRGGGLAVSSSRRAIRVVRGAVEGHRVRAVLFLQSSTLLLFVHEWSDVAIVHIDRASVAIGVHICGGGSGGMCVGFSGKLIDTCRVGICLHLAQDQQVEELLQSAVVAAVLVAITILWVVKVVSNKIISTQEIFAVTTRGCSEWKNNNSTTAIESNNNAQWTSCLLTIVNVFPLPVWP